MPIDLLFCWLMVTLRVGGLLAVFPALGGRALPPVVRVGIGVLVSSLLYGIVRHVNPAGWQWFDFLLAAAGEIVLGLGMGFMVRMTFGAVEFAGRAISSEIGFSAAPGLDAPLPSSEPLAAFLAIFAGLLFFLTGSHLSVIAAFARSFELAAAGKALWSVGAAEIMIKGVSRLIELGVRISAPFIAINFLINLAFAVLGRAVPKINVFVLSYPVKLIVGLMLLSSIGMLLLRYLAVEFQALPWRVLDLVGIS